MLAIWDVLRLNRGVGALRQLYVMGPVSDDGCGTITDVLIGLAAARGIDVWLTPLGQPPDPALIPDAVRARFVDRNFLQIALERQIPTLVHASPEHFHDTGLLTLHTTHDSTALPQHWVDRCNRARALIVPSAWLENLMRRQGVTVPMYCVPEGIDVADNPASHRPPDGRFRFLAVDKTIEPIIAAFQMAFGGDPAVELIVKSRSPFHTDADFTDLPEHVTAMPAQWLPKEMMDRLYFSAHCLVHPVEGAGWGLSISEALSKGVPVIANRHTDICEYTRPGDLLEPGFEERPYRFERWHDLAGQACGTKFHASVEEIAGSMIRMKAEYGHWKRRALQVRDRLVHEYTREHTVTRLLDTLAQITSPQNF